MNREQLRGVWSQVKGKAKVIIGELTDDEDKKAEGTVDKIYGRFQRRFGDVKQQVKDTIDKVRLP